MMKNKIQSVLITLILSTSILTAQDLELDVHVLPTSIIGDPAAFNIRVRNTDVEDAKGVTIQVRWESGLEFISYTPNTLDFNPKTGIWKLGTLEDKQSKVLTIMAKYAQRENALMSAEIVSSGGIDPDSTPGNGIDTNGNGKIIEDKGDEDDGDAAQNGPFN